MTRNISEADAVLSGMKTKQLKYETLVKAYHADVFRYAVWLIKDRAIAEDVVQETFLRAWKSLDSLQDDAAAKAWLITILRRENARRFERKSFDLVDIDDVSVADQKQENGTVVEKRDLRMAIEKLSDEYREPLVLQVMMGFSGDEIAEQLGLNKNTVMTRLFRARSQLKDIMTTNVSTEVKASG